MKKKLSYRDKLIELAYIYDVLEIKEQLWSRNPLTTGPLELFLKKNKIIIPKDYKSNFFKDTFIKPISKAKSNLIEFKEDKIRAKKMGIKDLSKKYEINEIVSGDSIFCATGITSGDLVSGIKIENDVFVSETLVTHKSTGLKKVIKLKQNI